MRCPYCNYKDTRVNDSRLSDGGESVRRRRQCPDCNERFTTLEQAILHMPSVVKSDGRREKFSEEKLRRGINRALEKRPIAGEEIEGMVNRIMRHFTREGEREIAVRDIGETVMRELRELDEVAFVRFASVYHKFQNLDAFNHELEKLRESQLSQPHKEQKTLFSKDQEGDDEC